MWSPLFPSISLLLVLAACAQFSRFDQYHQSIATFHSATEQTSQAVAKHILIVREVDRNRMFAQLESTSDPCSLPWARLRIEGRMNPEDCAFIAVAIINEGRFDRDAVIARRQLFNVLNSYIDLLSTIATSDAPQRWSVAASQLGNNASNLLETVDTVDRRGRFDQLGRLRTLVGEDGPLTRLAVIAGQDWINYHRNDALDTAIQTAAPQIEMISRNLREDFEFVRRYESFQVDDELGDAMERYANAIAEARTGEATDADVQRTLKTVRLRLEANELAHSEIHTIDSAIDAFDAAHTALVQYARSAKTPRDLLALTAAVERYAQAGRDIYVVYNALSKEEPEDG